MATTADDVRWLIARLGHRSAATQQLLHAGYGPRDQDRHDLDLLARLAGTCDR